MSRAAPDHAAAARRRARAAVLARPDGARADGGRRRAAIARTRSRAASATTSPSRGSDVVELDRLEELAVEMLGEVEGREALRQLRRYQELRELDLPIIILVGGATGTGKSTVATEIAYRLGITRVTSTDFIRQTMRAFFSHEFMPSIHYSSFEAGDRVARCRRSARRRLPRAVAQRARRRARVDRARARRRAGRWCSRACISCRACCRPPLENALVTRVRARRSRTRRRTRSTSSRARRARERPMAKYLDRFDEIRQPPALHRRARRARGRRR